MGGSAVRGVIPEVSIPKLGGGTSSSSSKYPANLCRASAPSRTFPSSENTEDDLRELIVSCAADVMRSRNDSQSPQASGPADSPDSWICWRNFFCVDSSRSLSVSNTKLRGDRRFDLILICSSATRRRWSVSNWALR